MHKIIPFFKSNFSLSFLFGALCVFAFAPFSLFFPAVISLSAFYSLLEKESKNWRVFFLGWCYGFGYFLAGIYWISISLLVDAEQFAWLIPFALILIPGVLALYIAFTALIYKKIMQRFLVEQVSKKIIIFAFLWFIFELLRSFLLTGFPWNLLGYIWLFNDALAQAASIVSVWGLSFFAVMFCLFPVMFMQFDNGFSFLKPDKKTSFFGTFLFLILILAFFYGHYYIDDKKMEPIKDVKLRLVQGNIAQDTKWDAQQKYQNFLKHIDLTKSSDLDVIDLVIWSETSVPYALGDNIELLQELQKAVPLKGSLITGALRLKYSDSDEIDAIWNSVFAIDKRGIIGYYDKHHLVPFGEYVPLEQYLPFINKITNGAIGFSRGDGPSTVKTSSLLLGPLLCYEVIFPDKIIDKTSRPDLLVNLTNDAWFGRSLGPYQHFDTARMRTIEYGIPMARVAATGITAFIDPFGRVIKKLNLNVEGIIDVNYVNKLQPTIYSRYGLYPLILLILMFFMMLLSKSINHSSHKNDIR